MKQLLLSLVLGFTLYYHGYRISEEHGLYYLYFHFLGQTEEHLVSGFGCKNLPEAKALADHLDESH